MRDRVHLGTLLILVGLAGCASEPEPPPLLPVETFTWSGGQPVSFAPPPEGWRRGREQSGGQEGVTFIKSGSVGEQIYVVEHLSVGKRDRCARLRSLIADMDELRERSFAQELQRTALYASPAINAREERMSEVVNGTLRMAGRAHRRGDVDEARRLIESALDQAGQIHYALDEVVERVIFTGEGFSGEISLSIGEAVPGELAGEPMIRLDYAMVHRGIAYQGRELYVLKNNRLFVINFQGLEENLPLFERVVETVSFPPAGCAH